MYFFCVVLCDVCFLTFPVLFVYICVLNNCHRVATQLQLNISYHINVCDRASVTWSDFCIIGQQTGSDKRYFSAEINAQCKSTYVEKSVILSQSKYHVLIKFDI
jgi:hypothetical protein